MLFFVHQNPGGDLLGVPIQPEDVGLLCVHFQPMNEHHDGAHRMRELATTIGWKVT